MGISYWVLNFGLGLSGLVVVSGLKGKEMGLVKRKGNNSRSCEKGRWWHCGKFHLAGTLTDHLGGQMTSISA